jgi:peroxiredoxin
MTEHRSPKYVSRLSTLAAAACLLASVSVWTGCTKDADTPSPPVTSNGGTSPSAAKNGATGEEDPHADADAGAGAAESATTDSGESSSAPSVPDVAAPGDDATEPVAGPGEAAAQNVAQQAAGSALPQPPPPAQVSQPEVVLSQHHTQTCLVGVGDQFPPLTLPDLKGNARDLAQLRGDRMTIIVFWTAQGFYAREQFSRIMYECHDRYAKLGVRVVAINVGDSPEVVEELATKNGVTIPCLLDVDGQAFRQAATGYLPRIYLLDAAGNIVWFDLEYSRSQRLGLHNAVYYQLKQNGA